MGAERWWLEKGRDKSQFADLGVPIGVKSDFTRVVGEFREAMAAAGICSSS